METIKPKETSQLQLDKSKRRYKFELPKTKFQLIREILKRWWYGLPQWPNPETTYTTALKEKGLRLVSKENWQIAPLVENGEEKVLEVPGFPGVFRNSKGQLHDLRDNSTKPSFRNLKKKEIKQLAMLLKVCLKNQIRALRDSEYYENNLDYGLCKFYRKFLKFYDDLLEEGKKKKIKKKED